MICSTYVDCIGPIISMFWMDEELCSDIYLNGVVTLVDAKYCMNQLSSTGLAHNQIEKEKGVGQRGGGVVGLGGVASHAGQPFQVNEATRQISLADVILLNKTDLVSAHQLSAVENAIL